MPIPHELLVSSELGISDRVLDALKDPEITPLGFNWRTSAAELDEEERLLRLAHVKALLPVDNALDEKTTHDATLENYIRLALHAAGDVRTLDTFLAHVQVGLERHPEQAEFLAQQVFWIWAPAAEIAGLYHHKERLEERAFGVLMPDEEAHIREQYNTAILEGADGLLGVVGAKISHAMRDNLPDKPFELDARPKSHYSVWRKLKNARRDNPELFDLLGFPIVIEGEDEVEAVGHCYDARKALTDIFEFDEDRFKDYIQEPKATGYRSLHITLYTETGFPFEVQIRTRRMHELTHVDSQLAHGAYDATYKPTPGKISLNYRKVPRLYQWRNGATRRIQQDGGQTDNVLGDEILFFRPDGNLYRMVNSGTMLDASFHIHSHRALCTGAIYRNGVLVGYGSPVKHGDVLNVRYNATYPTSQSKLDSLIQRVTSDHSQKALEKAKRKLMSDVLRVKGVEVISKLLGDVGLPDPTSILTDAEKRALADNVGAPSFNTLLEIIGNGNKAGKPSRIARFIAGRLGLAGSDVVKLIPDNSPILDEAGIKQKLCIPSTAGSLEYLVGGCCAGHIKYGDPVVARPSVLDGIFKVHQDSCRNIRTREGTIVCEWL